MNINNYDEVVSNRNDLTRPHHKVFGGRYYSDVLVQEL